MTRFWYDCEFLEDGRTIDLISIGIVGDDGREYYAVNSDMPVDRIKQHKWLMDNVWPHLPLSGHKSGLKYTGQGPSRHEVKLIEPGYLDTSDTRVRPQWVIANEVREFLLEGNPERDWRQTELWAWYGAYDHVRLAQLWGRMVNLPKGVPMWTNDVQQEAHRLGVDIAEAVPPVGSAHNALDDARRTKAMWEHLQQVAQPEPWTFRPSVIGMGELGAEQ